MQAGNPQGTWEMVEPLLRHMGPLSAPVQWVGAIVTAGWAVCCLLGINILGPDGSRRLKLAVGWLICILSGVALAWIYIAKRRAPIGLDLLPTALVGIVAGCLVFGAYAWLRELLTFRCPGDSTRHMRGFRLRPDAAKVLARDFSDLPPERAIRVGTAPTTQEDYFCTSGKDAHFIWTPGSLAFARLALIAPYILSLVLLVGGLGALAAELQLATEYQREGAGGRITIPSVLLFDFDESDLTERAHAYLRVTAQQLAAAAPASIRIEGHTDALGDERYNLELSRRRAEAVRLWLAARPEFVRTALSIRAMGESSPRLKEIDAKGHDDAEARRANRRVEIYFTSAP